jgi:hypothetical protein
MNIGENNIFIRLLFKNLDLTPPSHPLEKTIHRKPSSTRVIKLIVGITGFYAQTDLVNPIH